MDSDNDSYHSESEFYYPDEETLKETPKRQTLGLEHGLRTSGSVFPNTDLPASNNIYIFFPKVAALWNL